VVIFGGVWQLAYCLKEEQFQEFLIVLLTSDYINIKMGKNDNMNRGSDIEKYRKRIGKQEYKRNKTHVKEIKHKSQARRSATSIQDIALVLFAIFVLLVAVYLFFYFSFMGDNEFVDS